MARVLLLDEDAALCELIGLIARRLGHSFLALSSKKAALAHFVDGESSQEQPLVASAPADVIILDAAFTDAHHAAVLQAIDELEAEPSVVLMLSPWLPVDDDPRLAELSVSRVLHKPLEVSVLERELAELLSTPARPLGTSDTLQSDELRQRYQRSLQAEKATLDDAVARGAGPDVVKRALSRLAGTAGSYGYRNLSAQARMALRADHDDGPGKLQELTWLLGAALASATPPFSQTPSSLGPVRWPGAALVVGDDPEVITQVGEALASQGVALRFAPSVDEALELAEVFIPDLIVADARLAESSIDGFPIDEELREGFAHGLPMVLLGVPLDADERIRAANAGATVFADVREEGAVLRAAQALAPESYLGVPIIIVDDDPDITDLVTGLLSPLGVQVHVAHAPGQLFELLESVRPALVLLDIQLPTYGGHQLCRTMKAEPRWRDISIVYLTSDGRPETKVQAFNNGADDFLVKPVVAQELLAKVLSKLRFQQLAFQRNMSDTLTGALSKQGVQQRALALMGQPSRPEGCGLCLVEVEQLDQIRDEAGLLTAERALREAAEALGGAFLGRDSVGRWGALDTQEGHFLVLTLGGAPMAFSSAFERARRHLAEHPVFGPEGYFHQLSLSMGATALLPRDSLDAALARASQALERARQRRPALAVH